MTDEIIKVLEERGKRYGEWRDHAEVTARIKAAMQRDLPPYQREALDMIAHKIGRIICGDADYVDSWLDIAGYAQLVVNELKEEINGDVPNQI